MDEQTEGQLHQLNVSIEQAKKMIELGEALDRLQSNKDFQLLVQKEFLNDFAGQLVRSKSSLGMSAPAQQAYIDNGITAISYLDQWFRQTAAEARQAKVDLPADMATVEEIEDEEAN